MSAPRATAAADTAWRRCCPPPRRRRRRGRSSARAAMSAIRNSGLDGVSTHTMRSWGAMAPDNAARSSRGTAVTRYPPERAPGPAAGRCRRRVVADDDVVARLEQPQHRVLGSHPAREGRSVVDAFEVRRGIPRGRSGSGWPSGCTRTRCCRTDPGLGERRCLEDRRDDRAGSADRVVGRRGWPASRIRVRPHRASRYATSDSLLLPSSAPLHERQQVRARHDPDRVAAVEDQHSAAGLQAAQRCPVNRLAVAPRCPTAAPSPSRRLVEGFGVVQAALEQHPVGHRSHHLGQCQRRLGLHHRHLGDPVLLEDGDGGPHGLLGMDVHQRRDPSPLAGQHRLDRVALLLARNRGRPSIRRRRAWTGSPGPSRA